MTQQENRDESITQGSGNSNASAVIHDKTRTWIAVSLAASVLAMIYMGVEWRSAAMESRLKQYNLDWFRTHEFAEVSEKIQLQQHEILALQVSQACKKER